MTRRCLILLLGALPFALGAADAPHPATHTARQLWTVTDLILDKHVTPPARQEMLLAALKTLRATGSAELSRRVSAVVTEQQFADLLRELWPLSSPAKDPGTVLLQALLEAVPGKPALVPPEQHRVHEQLSNNRYVGIGIQVRWIADEGLTEIVDPFPGGPARRAGMKAGDRILEVDGVSVHNTPLMKVVEMLRGEEGTDVVVVVRQPGAAEKRSLKMTRAVVPFTLVVGHQRLAEEEWKFRVAVDAPIAYLRILRLTSSTPHELRRLERQLQAEGFRALVLDLRQTQDGELHNAALTADALLDGGLMWRVRDGRDNVKEYRADRDCLFRGWPVAVLVNELTGGPGPEALAAALQDNRRAILVGEATRGENFVTGYVPLPDKLGALRLRTGVVERPQPAQVVRPEHVVPLPKPQRNTILGWLASQERTDRPTGKDDKPPEDPQLAKAVELLRAALKPAKEGTPSGTR